MYRVDKFSPIVDTRRTTKLENWVVFAIVMLPLVNYKIMYGATEHTAGNQTRHTVAMSVHRKTLF